jgi:hypothetical protein
MKEQEIIDQIRILNSKLSKIHANKNKKQLQEAKNKFEGKYFKYDSEDTHYKERRTIKITKVFYGFVEFVIIRENSGNYDETTFSWNKITLDVETCNIESLEHIEALEDYELLFKITEIDEKEFYKRFSAALVRLEKLYSIDMNKIALRGE